MFKFCLNNVLRFFLIIMKILLNILIITILSINLSSADELQVFDFTETELAEPVSYTHLTLPTNREV